MKKPYCDNCFGTGLEYDWLDYQPVCTKCNGNSSPKPTLSERLYELAEKWEIDNNHINKYNAKNDYKISKSSELRNLLLEFGYKK